MSSWTSVGLALRRSHRDAMFEPFYGELVAGMDSVLATQRVHVLVQMVSDRDEEIACYERWAEDPRLIGAVLTDLVPDDRRLGLLRRRGLPGVVIGEPPDAHGMAVVRTDNRAAMMAAVSRLAGLGHRVIGRVSGPRSLLHTRARTEAFDAATDEFGVLGAHIEGDYSATSGASATGRFLERPPSVRPTAIIYDNDVMAVAGLDLVLGLGLRVPDEISIVAWDDSTLCRLARRPLSAMSHDIYEMGQLAARALSRLLDGQAPSDVAAPLPIFVPRESSGAVLRGAAAGAGAAGAGAAAAGRATAARRGGRTPEQVRGN